MIDRGNTVEGKARGVLLHETFAESVVIGAKSGCSLMKRPKGSSANSRVKYSIARETCSSDKEMGKNALQPKRYRKEPADLVSIILRLKVIVGHQCKTGSFQLKTSKYVESWSQGSRILEVVTSTFTLVLTDI